MPPTAKANFELEVSHPQLIAPCIRPSLYSDSLELSVKQERLAANIETDSLSSLRGLVNSLLRLVKLGEKMDLSADEDES